MNDQSEGVVIDAALRFAKSNPELLRYAQEHAGAVGTSADDLLLEAIQRVVAGKRGSASRRAAAG